MLGMFNLSKDVEGIPTQTYVASPEADEAVARGRSVSGCIHYRPTVRQRSSLHFAPAAQELRTLVDGHAGRPAAERARTIVDIGVSVGRRNPLHLAMLRPTEPRTLDCVVAGSPDAPWGERVLGSDP
jgi:hypothetical protein